MSRPLVPPDGPVPRAGRRHCSCAGDDGRTAGGRRWPRFDQEGTPWATLGQHMRQPLVAQGETLGQRTPPPRAERYPRGRRPPPGGHGPTQEGTPWATLGQRMRQRLAAQGETLGQPHPPPPRAERCPRGRRTPPGSHGPTQEGTPWATLGQHMRQRLVAQGETLGQPHPPPRAEGYPRGQRAPPSGHGPTWEGTSWATLGQHMCQPLAAQGETLGQRRKPPSRVAPGTLRHGSGWAARAGVPSPRPGAAAGGFLARPAGTVQCASLPSGGAFTDSRAGGPGGGIARG